jgi:phosphate transport system permease protein
MKTIKFRRARLVELFVIGLMGVSFTLVAGSLGLILGTVVIKGLPVLDWAMLTQAPQGGFYLGKQGGILNAILGSLYLAAGGTGLACAFSLPIVLYLRAYAGRSGIARAIRLTLDILWGVPSIVYGAFGFVIMLALGLRASLLGGILALSLLELPILARAMDEVLGLVQPEMVQASLALGATRLETAWKVILRQAVPGLVTAVMLAFGRGFGDAASILFTAGYTDNLPGSLLRPVASLPLAVFFQLGTPFPEVQQRAYAAALILTLLVLAVSLGSRWLAGRLSRFTIK